MKKATGIIIIIFCSIFILSGLPGLALALGRICGFVYLVFSGKTSGAGPEKLAILIGHAVGVIVMNVIFILGLRYGIRKVRSTSGNEKAKQ